MAANQGQFFDSSGKPAFQKGGGLEALTYMLNTEVEGLSNPHSREYLEEDVRRVFSSGQAAFALNWTYMYNLANDPKESQVAGKVGVAPAPGWPGRARPGPDGGSGWRPGGPWGRSGRFAATGTPQGSAGAPSAARTGSGGPGSPRNGR